MKTKFFILCILCASTTLLSKAQQQQTAASANNAAQMQIKTSATESYSYKVFQAPNKTYGYDIFKNSRGVFHQPPNANPADKAALLQQAIAEKAANLSIEKLKTNALPKLSAQEIQKLLNN